MSVIVTEMVSVTSRIESSHFHGLGTELRTSGSARLFQAMFFQCLWEKQSYNSCQATWFYTELKPLPALPESVGTDCSPGSEDLSIALLASLKICPSDCWELHRGSNMPRCWNAKSHLFSPSCPLQGISEVLFWGILQPPSRSWNSFYGVLIAYTTVQKRWFLHDGHRP